MPCYVLESDDTVFWYYMGCLKNVPRLVITEPGSQCESSELRKPLYLTHVSSCVLLVWFCLLGGLFVIQLLVERRKESLRTGVPHPLAASHPVLVGKPVLLHPLLLPCLISVNPFPSLPASQIHGFKNPNAGLPSAISASLTRAIIDANVGALALVPLIRCFVPFQMTAY